MGDTKPEIGKRLREIRHIFLEGDKVSTRQFANALSENKDNIANYEMGRANIPNRLLLALYERGFNPIYILAGEGSLFADNEMGRYLKEKVDAKKVKKVNTDNTKNFDFTKLSVRELERKVTQYQVAAGDIMRILELKKQEEVMQ